MEEVAEGVHRLGSTWVNFYIVEDGDALTVVDAGLLGYADQLDPALAQLGRKSSDVKSIVLTHTHSDHIGCAPTFMAATGAPLLVPVGEIDVATGVTKPSNPRGLAKGFVHGNMYKFIGHFLANKGLSRVFAPEATPYATDEVLDVPGKLRVVSTPGHSKGHCALLLEGRKILFCGDALATLNVSTGETGPMSHPFNADRAKAIASLDFLEGLDADLLLPGHGDPWKGRVPDAVAAAKRRLAGP